MTQETRKLTERVEALEAEVRTLKTSAVEEAKERHESDEAWRLLHEENKRLRAALRTIARWDRDTFPRVPDRDDPAKTWSYGAAYGSNGERDFMRQIALDALGEGTATK